ncbi:calcium-binding protein [Stagnihabitans tardus]|uniref:Calcium-binding protein n=1 Tax=Stagnihabitans tardus TaxID=2699202 RepID=A0AAE4YA68_9RHOB|nr:calcium-binding protein [Stagnihabitans tardus]NBZ88164.1 hypothetical protein [Stagnihabitans tardus]
MPIMTGTSGDDIIPRGSATIDGGGNVSWDVDDTIYGLGGHDFINGGGGNNLIYGGQGNDNTTGGNRLDTIYGGLGDDFLSGNAGDDTLMGDAGNDFIWVFNGDGATEGGSDVVNGGTGNDMVQLDEYGLSTGATVTGGADTDKLQIKLGGYYHTDGTLDRSAYLVDLSRMWGGGVGIVGGSSVRGFEALNGIQGGAGDDTIIVGRAYTVNTATLVNGVLAQNLYRGWDGNDYISGGDGSEQVNGDAGNDTLIGNGGDDYLEAGAGNDSVHGGDGHDVLFGGPGHDLVQGGAGNDSIYGDDGNDTMDGGSGNDNFAGYDGNDVYIVDSLGDYVGDTGGIDTVRTGIDYSLSAWPMMNSIENLLLTGTAVSGMGNGLDNVLTGNGADNVLSGLAGRDTLTGGVGSDRLKGGAGSDLLNGGTGPDSFVFDTLETSAQRDRITDFMHGIDMIVLDRSVFTAFAADPAGALAPLAFVAGTHTQTPDQHLIYNATTGVLLYDADGKGGAAAVHVALLTTKPLLDAGDIWLI